jgi:photosystem II stability/assembly factor-like uncharacterized protein
VVFLLLFIGAAGAAQVWKSQVSTNEIVLNDVAAADPQYVWAVGDAGAILATTDRGATWTPVASGTGQDLSALAIGSRTYGWAVGNTRTLVKYDGSSWTASQLLHVSDLDLTDVVLTGTSTVAVTVGAGFTGSLANYRNFFISRDGGTTWTGSHILNTAETDSTFTFLYGAYFLDANNGWVAGINTATTPVGKVFKTTDGGVTWQDVSPVGVENVEFRDIYFANNNLGWAAGGDSNTSNGYIYQTTNGGVSWTPQFSANPAFPKHLSGNSSKEIWSAERDHGGLLNYDGTNWSEFTVVTSGYFNSVNSPDPWNTWAVGGLLSAEVGGPMRYVYKLVTDPYSLVSDRKVYIGTATYEADLAFSGKNIQTNSTVTLEVESGVELVTYEVRYVSSEKKNKIDARVKIDPVNSRTGTYYFYLANPDESTSGRGTFVVEASATPVEKPVATTLPAKTFDPATDPSLTMQVATPGELTANGVRTSSVPPDVLLELVVYRYSNRQIVYRKQFNADPSGYTTVTLQKLTDLGVDISDGIYNAIVIHPRFGKIGSGIIVVHHSR